MTASPSPGPPKDNPGVIAPPPLVFAGILLLGLAIDFVLVRVRTGFPEMPRYALFSFLIVAAAALIAAAFGRFRRAGTHVEPWKPSTAIVTDGVYRFTRNPIYLGMALAYVGLALAADSLIALVLLAPALVVMSTGVIAREERYLEGKFGDEYRRYKASVRRWV